MPNDLQSPVGTSLRFLAFALIAAGVLPMRAAERPPEQEIRGPTPMLESNIDRPLRYFPENGDFVITNGTEYFNRPLYSANAPFRIDGGDRPEFSLYAAGRAGNLRMGLASGGISRWLHAETNIVARYRAGSLIYDFPTASGNLLRMTVVPFSDERGMIARIEPGPVLPKESELIVAFGGVNGMRGRRSGDIGCENLPVSEFFQLRPEQCRDDKIALGPSRFITRGRPGAMLGYLPGAHALIGNAEYWQSLPELVNSTSEASNDASNKLVVLRLQTVQRAPVHFVLVQVDTNATWHNRFNHADEPELARWFAAAENNRRAVAEHVVIETPDPFINAAASALNVAADGVWDERQQSFMHGAVAWRNRLLGWRGIYSGDALGWHERTRLHFEGFARQQNTNPIPAELSPADASANLSRSEAALHSNGNMTRNHYDMNLVAVDAFFRHLLWTGDLAFAERMWPVIERHLAWERRLFRREFGPDKLPLYEAYAAIWASDDLAYNGGGSTHGSAYNYFHNRMAARVAELLGKDASLYEREAELIARGMREHLWLKDRGWFAEWKDYLGEQRVHPNAAVWTFYHTLDSQVPTPLEAFQMTRFVDAQIPRIPIRGPNVPGGNFTVSTTCWMPYTWSLNNVVLAESMHTALAYWQAGRLDSAVPLFKGALLDSMFLGLCPGNVGLTTFYDANRRETQRDFADGVGAMSRAMIEGLFGVQPDALAGELVIAPGFPVHWNSASIRHPDFDFDFSRDGAGEHFTVTSRFTKPMKLRLRVNALREEVASAAVNAKPAMWRKLEEVPGRTAIEITADPAATQSVVIDWKGNAVPRAGHTVASRTAVTDSLPPALNWNRPLSQAKFNTINLATHFNDRVSQIFKNEYLAPRSPFCSLSTPRQGIGSWCHPNDSFEVDDSGLRAASRNGGGRITLPNGVPLATPDALDSKNILFTSQWTNYPAAASIPLSGTASHAFLLMAGSTSPMQSRFDNGEVIVTYSDGSTARLPLHNPINWWPIDQDYFIDDFAFRRPEPIPPRVDLKTGNIRVLNLEEFKGKGRKVPGGAATVLDLPLDPAKELKSLTIRAIANEVVIGLMSVTLQR